MPLPYTAPWGRPAAPALFLCVFVWGAVLPALHPHGPGTSASGLGVKGEPSLLSRELLTEPAPLPPTGGKRANIFICIMLSGTWYKITAEKSPPWEKDATGEDINSFCKPLFSISVPFGKWASKFGTLSLCLLPSAHSTITILSRCYQHNNDDNSSVISQQILTC